MMRTTAFPASIIAQMMARGDVLMRGATPQEKAIDPEKFVPELVSDGNIHRSNISSLNKKRLLISRSLKLINPNMN